MFDQRMSLRPFFTYYGGKWRIAGRYPPPRYDCIVEPFAGSAGYSVRHNAKRVALFDLDEKIVATWQFLIGASEREIRALPLLGPHDDVRDLRVPQEARWVIGWWLNKGMTAPCNIPSAWMRTPSSGRAQNFWSDGVRERLARQVCQIRHWRIWQMSYADIPTDVEATWFVDPPYDNAAGRRYRHSRIDYDHLGAWCQSLRGQVVVCENEGADWLPFSPFLIAKASEGKHKAARGARSREAIWVNDVRG